MTKLIINSGEMEFSDFNNAVKELSAEYGYKGLAWDMVVSSCDFDVLFNFLENDGIDAVLWGS